MHRSSFLPFLREQVIRETPSQRYPAAIDFFSFFFFPPKEITRNLCPKQFRFKCICTRDIPRHLLYPRHFLGRKELPSLSRETISLSPSNLIAPLANEPSFQPVPGWIPPSLTGGESFFNCPRNSNERERRWIFAELLWEIDSCYQSDIFGLVFIDRRGEGKGNSSNFQRKERLGFTRLHTLFKLVGRC